MTAQPQGTPAERFSEREFQIVTVARMVEDGKTYWVAGGGSPMYSVLLAKRLQAPHAVYVTEDGVLDPEPSLPFDPIMTMVTAKSAYRALQWGTMNTVQYHAALGLMDYGILNCLQIDPYGNINSTIIGDYEAGEGRRFGGPGGADSIAALCWRLIIMTDQQKRRFVPRVDFISSAGYLDGTPDARERAGLPRGTGPWRVVTPWAVFDFAERRLRLIATAPWVTVADLLNEMSFRPQIAEPVETLAPPIEEELLILRSQLDVRGQTTDIGRWLELREGRYVFVEETGREAGPLPRAWL